MERGPLKLTRVGISTSVDCASDDMTNWMESCSYGTGRPRGDEDLQRSNRVIQDDRKITFSTGRAAVSSAEYTAQSSKVTGVRP